LLTSWGQVVEFLDDTAIDLSLKQDSVIDFLKIFKYNQNQNVYYLPAKEKKEKTQPRIYKEAKNQGREEGFS